MVDEVVEISLQLELGSVLKNLFNVGGTDVLASEGVVRVARNGCGNAIHTLSSPIESGPLCCIHGTSFELGVPMGKFLHHHFLHHLARVISDCIFPLVSKPTHGLLLDPTYQP